MKVHAKFIVYILKVNMRNFNFLKEIRLYTFVHCVVLFYDRNLISEQSQRGICPKIKKSKKTVENRFLKRAMSRNSSKFKQVGNCHQA